jgi:hypothetical protein
VKNLQFLGAGETVESEQWGPLFKAYKAFIFF